MRILTAILIMLLVAGSAVAQETETPTPSATPPLFPTATPWARPTPTLIVITDPHVADPLDISTENVAAFTDSVIQFYNFLNLQGVIDTMIWIMMSFLLLGLMTRLARSWKQYD